MVESGSGIAHGHPPLLHYSQASAPAVAAPCIPWLADTKESEQQYPEIPELADAHVCYPIHSSLHSTAGTTNTANPLILILFIILPFDYGP